MNKKIIGALLAVGVCLSATLGGCAKSTNSRVDMQQCVAEVRIADVDDKLKDDIVKNYGDKVGGSSIIKRDLIAYFLNVGSTYIQSGYGYEQTFNLLIDSLVENEVLTQYSTMYLLDKKVKESGESSIAAFLDTSASEDKRYESLLDDENIRIAKYNLYSVINSAIDRYEQLEIDDDEDEGEGTRSTPGNVDVEIEDYYPGKPGELDYAIYTGYEGYLLDKSGQYKEDALDGTTNRTRRSAYNRFLKSLKDNYLISDDESGLTDVLSLNYVKEEYVNQLKQQVIEVYYDMYEDDLEAGLTSDYLTRVFDNTFNLQTNQNANPSSFTGAMDSMGDSSFVLYAPDPKEGENRFGFVYNILLPFSGWQSVKLTDLQNKYRVEDGTDFKDAASANSYYAERNAILKQIVTTDQRNAWVNGETEYYFDASDSGLSYYKGKDGDENRNVLFFEDNLTKSDRYEQLSKYAGLYTYNGTVNENGIPTPKTLTIDDMLEEFVGYVNFVMGSEAASITTNNKSTYYDTKEFRKSDINGDKYSSDYIDFSKFIYAEGKVAFSESSQKYNRENLLKNDKEKGEISEQYKALSAVNELQYAYTTDTAVLSNYLGYSVAAGDTSFIKEFEYAAQKAVRGGAGSFNVCAGDYGWHLIYCTYAFDVPSGEDKNQLSHTADWQYKDVEGTFENLFYEWVKSTDLPAVSTTRRSKLISVYKKDSTVKKYEDRYRDLLDME